MQRRRKTDIELKIKLQERQYLTQFLELGVDSDLETRRRTAQYFATLTPTEDYRLRWEKFLSIIEGEIALKEAKAKEIKEEAKGATGEELVALRKELSALKLSLGARALLPSELTSVGVMEHSLVTGDHHCESDCRGEPTRTNYVLTLKARPGHILRNPKVRCEGEGCGWSRTLFITVGDDGREARASFDVWSRPTRWTISAESFKLEKGDA
ncbi:MAG: hypothetical protein OMM_05916 [Candidatus Magnetoglobus multicellularis str. Araruama]|uniref:Uncharacterized protein n=1 Tax=Candidatus Magnetoglobus multicellularis str. Araruama TaxID=890399 RepID=A0A1V1NT83_9BACT|nr:MAG: hypothetical protein OMM_05916 [Candidatus Magnetoglobus multicellularis str. Araruama]